MSEFKFTAADEKQAAAILKRYPHKASAVMPFLTLAQKRGGGHLSAEAMRYVAARLGMAAMRVYEVATFYDMYHTHPVGKYHLGFCNSISCWLRGSAELIKRAERLTAAELGGGASGDGVFSIEDSPCLGACVNAPVVMINGERYAENLTLRSMEELIASLRRDSRPEDLMGSKSGGKNAAEAIGKSMAARQ